MVMGIISSCYQGRSSISQEEKNIDQAIAAAVDYASSRLKDSKQSTGKDGIITLSANGFNYYLNPAKIIISEIDEDSVTDAIIPLDLLKGQSPVFKEHLILLNKDGKLVIDTAVYNIVNILKAEDRIIIAEISKVGIDAPGYGCAECIEIAKYKLREGMLVRIE